MCVLLVHTIEQYQHIEAETKWPPFRRRQFQMYLLEWKYMDFDWNVIAVCS